MNKQIALKFLINNIGIIGAIFMLLYCILKKKPLLKREDGRIDFILKIVGGIVLVGLFIHFTIPTMMDIPYLINSDYKIISGVAMNRDQGTDRWRYVVVRSKETSVETGVEFFANSGIEEGEYISIKYLPHTKCGILLEKGEQ